MNFPVKKLGFGLMRLPQKDGVIDIEQTKAMVDKFMKAGFTYFDTAWAYPNSEDAMRQALVERYPRDSFTVATKLAAWINCKTKAEAEAQFETSLKQSGVDYFDFYLLHNLGEGRTKFFDDWDIWGFAQQKKKEGLIRSVGFSFHSTADELEAILTAHPEMEFVQLQINYADWESNSIQSRACFEVAKRHNIPIIAMEPVKGGLLANPPETVASILKNAAPDASAASWAVRFAASLDEVKVVLSGMSTLEQVDDNVSYMENFVPLSAGEQATIEEARKALAALPIIPCTSCNYCAKVCPSNIGISGTFEATNMVLLYKNTTFAKEQLKWLVGGHGKAGAENCTQCGACVPACPQHINIPDELKKATQLLA